MKKDKKVAKKPPETIKIETEAPQVQQQQQQQQIVTILQQPQQQHQVKLKHESQPQQIILSMSQAQAMIQQAQQPKGAVYTFPMILNANSAFMTNTGEVVSNFKFDNQ